MEKRAVEMYKALRTMSGTQQELSKYQVYWKTVLGTKLTQHLILGGDR